MGEFTTGIAFNQEVDLNPLVAMFPDKVFHLYKIGDTGLFLLDSYDEDDYPFSAGVAEIEDIIYPIPDSLFMFRKNCHKAKIGTPYLPKSSLGLPYLLSKKCDTTVGDFQSDDDDSEIYIQFTKGKLDFIKFIADDLLVEFTESEINVYPMFLEMEDEETTKKALEIISLQENVVIHKRENEYDLQLHAFVEKELSGLCGARIEILEDAEWDQYQVVFNSSTG